MMLVWGPAEACSGAWPSPDSVRSPLVVASFFFLRWSSSCLFLFSSIQLQGSAAAASVFTKSYTRIVYTKNYAQRSTKKYNIVHSRRQRSSR